MTPEIHAELEEKPAQRQVLKGRQVGVRRQGTNPIGEPPPCEWCNVTNKTKLKGEH